MPMRGNVALTSKTAVSASSTPFEEDEGKFSGDEEDEAFRRPVRGRLACRADNARRRGAGGPPVDPAPAGGPSRSPGDRSEADDDDEICESHTQSPTQPSHFALHPVAAGEGGRASLRRFRPSSYRGGGLGEAKRVKAQEVPGDGRRVRSMGAGGGRRSDRNVFCERGAAIS